jgi:RimJ/RimL family protein N-acetyltransferase
MLKGKVVTLRPPEERDIDEMYRHILDVENRGEFYPRQIYTLAGLRKELNEDGFWARDHGLLLLIHNATDKMIGQMAWFKTVQYMTELEIGYITFDRSARGKGAMTEAVQMLTRYLFDIRNDNRIILCIATENKASRRVAEKAGYTHEGTQRGAWWNNGKHYDMELYAFLREDLPPA